MSALLCCGPIFESQYLLDDGILYKWLDSLLTSKDEKVNQHVLRVLYKFNKENINYFVCNRIRLHVILIFQKVLTMIIFNYVFYKLKQ